MRFSSSPRRTSRVLPWLCGFAALLPAAAAQSHKLPADCFVRGARGLPAGSSAAYVLREGRIRALLDPGAEGPAGAFVIDAQGLIALPAFLDAYTTVGCPARAPAADRDLPTDTQADVDIDMRDANRKGIQPAYRAAEVAQWTKEQRSAWRKAGFGHALVSPAAQILSGTSALLSTREAAARDAILAPEVFAHAGFSATGPGYPSTSMGYTAQLRQFFSDARRHSELRQRFDQGRPGVRPAWDADLDALQPVLARTRRVAALADRANEIDRWLELSTELGFELVIVGGRDAHYHAARLAARGVPVVLTLDWGEEVEKPKDPPPAAAAEALVAAVPEKYDEPLPVRLERRRKWEETRDGALVLQRAGVELAFGTAGGTPIELFGRVRKLVENGFPIEVARAALTSNAARLLGAERRLGALEAGRDASLALWTSDPLDPKSKDARLRWIIVDGWAEEFPFDAAAGIDGPPAPGIDLHGTWSLALTAEAPGPRVGEAKLEMELDGSVRGEVVLRERADAEPKTCTIKGKVGGKQAKLGGRLGSAESDPEWTMKLAFKDGRWTGEFDVKIATGAYKAKIEFTQVPEHDEELFR
jgi:imidazolonepropionase-like amidohydrolase